MTNETKPTAEKKIFFLRKRFIAGVIFLLAMGLGGICGIFMHKYKIFPYNKLRSAYNDIPKEKVYGPWSIGIYEGTSPFDLVPYPGIKNPVLTGKNCGDAVFVADPFMVIKDNKYFIFFEAVDRASNEGNIAYAESTDLKHWEYKKWLLMKTSICHFPMFSNGRANTTRQPGNSTPKTRAAN